MGSYPIERLPDRQAYWELHEAALRPHFPPEFFFNLGALLSAHETEGRARLEAEAGGDPLFDFWVARDQGNVVAMFCGHQRDADTYRMWHSHVHPDYRRRGVYGDIVRRMIGYSRDLGFSRITSEHAPNNNAILIAKLKAGFHIVGMNIDPSVGPGVLLEYFHNPAHRRAYAFRCGMATLDHALLASGTGAMPLLLDQLRAFVTAPPEQARDEKS